MVFQFRWKGKEKARVVAEPLAQRDEGSGGMDGVVLPLDLVGSGVFDVAYTLPIRLGETSQQFNLQVDSGSSDLWVASSSCSTSSCGQVDGKLYKDTDARITGHDFSINYLQGSVSGPIVWDRVEIGGYSIENQAFAAADVVNNEPLAPNFNGILGLALPLNSIIAQEIPPVTNNSADGAAWASNLFSITPTTSAPSSRFISLSLSRPGSNRIPSLLGIGRHPSQIVQNASDIKYASLVSESSGTLYWKTSVRAITVYVNGEAKPVEIGRASSGAVFPTAVLDSGVPLILTTSTIANAIYGAIGVGPGSDGQYYVPCNTPLNMSITLDTRPPLPLHPLDLTAEPPTENTAQTCIGLIQTADSQLASPQSQIGDMILGVPFLRNTYTVMAYAIPNSDGTFNPNTLGADGSAQPVRPRLGLMGLTDPRTALDEFNTVRVLNKPLDPDNAAPGGINANPSSADGSSGGGVTQKKLSVGIIVLIGLGGFIVLVGALFALRWVLLRRRFKRRGAGDDELSPGSLGADDKRELAYHLAFRGPKDGLPSEDSLREMKYQAYLRKEKILSMSSSQTRVGDVTEMEVLDKDKDRERIPDGGRKLDDEFGKEFDPYVWDATSPIIGGDNGDDTLVAGRRRGFGNANGDDYYDYDPDSPKRFTDGKSTTPTTATSTSGGGMVRQHGEHHDRHSSIVVPLLHRINHSEDEPSFLPLQPLRDVHSERGRGLHSVQEDSISTDIGEFGEWEPSQGSMIDAGSHHSRMISRPTRIHVPRGEGELRNSLVSDVSSGTFIDEGNGSREASPTHVQGLAF